MDGNFLLTINFVVYLLTFLIYVKKKKAFDLGTVCLFTFTLSSLGSVWYYSFDKVSTCYPDMNVIAFSFIYIVFLMFVMPLLFINYRQINMISSSRYQNILHVISCFYAIIAVPVFLNLVFNFLFKSFGGNALNSMYESDVDNATLIFVPGIKQCYSLMRRFYDLIAFLFCYNLFINSNIKIRIGLALSVLSFFMVAFQGGSRGGIIMNLIALGGFILLFYHLYSNKVRRFVQIAGVSVCGLLVLGLSAISVSRFAANDTKDSDKVIDQWIAQYLGEGMVRFSDDCFPIKEQLNGDKNFSFIKSIVGFKEETDNEKANLKYEAKLKIPTSVFYTFIGSYYLDFNFVGTLFIAILVLCVMMKVSVQINKQCKIGFIEALILIKFFKMIATGFTSNVFAVTSVQQDEFVFWIVITCISILSFKDRFTPPITFEKLIKYRIIEVVCSSVSVQPLKPCTL